MAKRHIVAGLVLIALGAWYVHLIGNLPLRSIMPNTPGPSFFPIIIAVAVLGLSSTLLISGLIGLRKDFDVTVEESNAKTSAIALSVFALYLAILPYAGFILASVPFYAVLMYLYGSRSKLLIVAASAILPIAVFVIFRYAFQIVLPRGILAF